MLNLAKRVKLLRVGDTLVRRNPLIYHRARRLYDYLESCDFESRKKWTLKRLQYVLSKAAKTTYGKEVRGGKELDSWPLLDKVRVHNRPEDFLRFPKWLTSPGLTSGTTGVPLKTWCSFTCVAFEQAAIDRLLIAKGVSPVNCRAAVLRGDDIKHAHDTQPPFWKVAGGGKRLIFSSKHLSPSTLQAFVDKIKEFKPQVLYAYPTIVESFCVLLRNANLRVSIPITVGASEALTPQAWELAETTLNTKAISYYGQAERVAFAYAFEKGIYRFLPGYGYTELLLHDSEDDADIYEIVATAFWNLAMPFVRYRTGDYIRLPKNISSSELESIALGTTTFGGVIGRSGDYLIHPNGVRLMGIDHIPRGIENILRMQVIQETPERVRLLVIPEPGFSDKDRDAIMRNAAFKLPPPMKAELEIVDQLERTQQQKTPFVIRRFTNST